MKSRLTTHVAQAVRSELKARSWSQADFARRVGRTQPFVSQLLSGRRTEISLETAVKIARALGKPLDALVGSELKARAPLTDLERARRWLLNPPPGSKARAAMDFGVDLSLNARLIGQTVTERILSMQRAANDLSRMKRARTQRRA